MRFVDPRTFGEMFVTSYDDLEQVEELAHLGLDPLETALSWERFGRMLAERKMRLKALLMDQKFIAGIGNIYSDEILFQAGLRWDRMSDSLSQQEIRRLYRAIIETLQDAVKYRGSSLSDEQYRDLFGQLGDIPAPPPGVRPRRPGLLPVPAPARASPVLEPLDLLLRGMSGLTQRRRARSRRPCAVITGRVQGVWFRDACREQARALGVGGFVRNRSDGAVDAEFEGPPAAVDRMVAWCHEGPPRAHVTRRGRGTDHAARRSPLHPIR